MSKSRKIVNADNIQPIEPDIVRVGIKENAIQFEFGQAENPDRIVITSAIRLNPKYLQQFMMRIVESGIAYEKKFDADIGFNTFWKTEEK